MSQFDRALIDSLGVEYAYTIKRLRTNKRRRAKVAERRRRVIEALTANPALTVAELTERFGVSMRTAKMDRAAVRAMLSKYECRPICGHELGATTGP